ncbi:MAG: hypothetical protein F9K30_23810 [Dechloromonas sp.]|nr:MAG: hypothetical protein F9K30_23810 [Dechloromonas sp.]
MNPLQTFETAWARCDQLSALHAYLAANVTSVLQPDEILRAEWAARVSALDLYVHELVAQRLGEIFAGTRPSVSGFAKFQIDAAGLLALKQNPATFQNHIDLEVRSKLERRTFQYPVDIADGIRCISDVELWNSVALADGATEQTKVSHAKTIKSQLTQIVNRRNKIVHEADLQPVVPRVPWPISTSDVLTVRTFVEKTVKAIDTVVI